MRAFLLTIQLIVAVSLIGLVMLQSSKGGLSGAVAVGEMYRSRRGAERIVFTMTIIASIAFLVISVVNLFAV